MENNFLGNKTEFYRKFIPFTISLALFMEAVDTTIINTAIPAMAISLQVDPIDLKIALISYLMSLAIFIPISGWIADKYGIKRVFITATSVFIFASFACGYAANLTELVIARTIQGIGGALMTPVGRLIVARCFERHELIIIMNRIVTVAAMGMMLGPAIGGYITYYFSWRWIFWVNIPIGLFTIAIASYGIINMKPLTVPKLDKVGFILFGLGIASLSFGFSVLSQSSVSPIVIVFALLIAALLLILYGIHSRHQAYPIINTNLFLYKTFRISVMGNMILRTCFGGIPFLLPLLLQFAFGYTSELSGLMLAPIALGVILIKPFSYTILQRAGYKRLLIINTFCIGILLWLLTFINAEMPTYCVGLFTFAFGFFIALQYTGMNSLAYAEIPSDKLGSTTSLMGTVQQVSQSFGVALAALLLHIFSLQTNNHHLSASVFYSAFFIMGLGTLLSTGIFMALHPKDGEQMIPKHLEHH